MASNQTPVQFAVQSAVIPPYIKGIICEAYKVNTKTDSSPQSIINIIFIMYYILRDDAWFKYQNLEEKTTPTDRYFNSETNVLTYIVSESHANECGLSFENVRLNFPDINDGESRYIDCKLLTHVGKLKNFPEKGGFNKINVFERNYWYEA